MTFREGEVTMLIVHDLRKWLFKAKDNWDSAAGENGDQTGDFGCQVFSDIFKSLVKAIAELELPTILFGKYVCQISGYDEMVRIIWFEPAGDACCSRQYEVCLLTAEEVNSAADLEQLWQVFIVKFKQGLVALATAMAIEIAVCQKRLKNCKLALNGLKQLSSNESVSSKNWEQTVVKKD